MPAIAREHFDDAAALMDALSPRDPRWAPWPGRWVFRGQRDASWPLVPSALRPGARLHYTPGPPPPSPATHREQIEAELGALMDFYDAVDRQGLPIPEDSQTFRTPDGWRAFTRRVLDAAIAGAGPWLPGELLSLAALAQHYGVPTRLIDWSDSARKAAYFAARPAAEERATAGTADGRLGVWAVNAWYLERAFDGEAVPRVILVTAPRGSNPFLHAQGGVFTLDRTPSPADAPVEAVPFDRVVDATSGRTDSPVMRLLTLPASAAPTLMRLLAWEQVHAGALLPGFQGAAASLEERRLWDRSGHRA